MSFKLNKIFVLSFVVVISLMVSNISFAAPEDDLRNAIGQNNLQAAENALKSGVDFQKITYFNQLPTIEMSNLLLRYGFGLERFLGVVLGVKDNNNSVQFIRQKKELVAIVLKRKDAAKLLLKMVITGYWKNNQQSDTSYVVHLLPEEQEYCITLALDSGAKFSEIKLMEYEKRLACLPSIKVAKLLLENNLDPTLLVKASLEANHYKPGQVNQLGEVDKEIVDRKLKIVELALGTGRVDFSGIYHFSVVPPLKLSELLLNKGLNVDKFLKLVMSAGNGGEHQQMLLSGLNRRAQVLLALKEGAKPSILLGEAIRSNLSIEDKEYYVELARKNGAKYSEVDYKSGFCSDQSIEIVKRMYNNSLLSDTDDKLDPNDLFISALSANCLKYTNPTQTEIDKEVVEKRDDLIMFALKKGANPDRLLELAVNQCYFIALS